MKDVTQMIRAASDAFRGVGVPMRERGWPVEIVVFAPGALERFPEQFVVTLALALPEPGGELPRPREARPVAEAPTEAELALGLYVPPPIPPAQVVPPVKDDDGEGRSG